MHPALMIDVAVSKTANLHPILRAIIHPILYPFMMWRMKGIATTLRTKYRWLPATSFHDVEKHGENVVYCMHNKIDIFTKKKEVIGVWVVDYKNKTVRIVSNAPEEYQKTGATF